MTTQKKERFDTQSLTREAEMLTREVVTAPFRLKTYRLLRKVLLGFIFVSIANVLFSYFFYTPKMYRIVGENREYLIKYRILQDRIRTAQRKVGEIRHRDNNVYRSLFSTDTLGIEGVYTPYSDSKYADIAQDNYAPLMIGTWKQIDALGRMLYLESVSLDELQILSKNKEQLSMAVPAIWPIDRQKLRNNHIGAFNPRRLHPIYHRIIAHIGVDLPCNKGTLIYATGDAVVDKTDDGLGRAGYGKQVLLDHEFGYKTRYAHLSRILVKPGDKVVRGQVIAESGNTGGSTAPHLHYEVIHKGVPVNPINYFDRNMSGEEYNRLMQESRDTEFETL